MAGNGGAEPDSGFPEFGTTGCFGGADLPEDEDPFADFPTYRPFPARAASRSAAGHLDILDSDPEHLLSRAVTALGFPDVAPAGTSPLHPRHLQEEFRMTLWLPPWVVPLPGKLLGLGGMSAETFADPQGILPLVLFTFGVRHRGEPFEVAPDPDALLGFAVTKMRDSPMTAATRFGLAVRSAPGFFLDDEMLDGFREWMMTDGHQPEDVGNAAVLLEQARSREAAFVKAVLPQRAQGHPSPPGIPPGSGADEPPPLPPKPSAERSLAWTEALVPPGATSAPPLSPDKRIAMAANAFDLAVAEMLGTECMKQGVVPGRLFATGFPVREAYLRCLPHYEARSDPKSRRPLVEYDLFNGETDWCALSPRARNTKYETLLKPSLQSGTVMVCQQDMHEPIPFIRQVMTGPVIGIDPLAVLARASKKLRKSGLHLDLGRRVFLEEAVRRFPGGMGPDKLAMVERWFLAVARLGDVSDDAWELLEGIAATDLSRLSSAKVDAVLRDTDPRSLAEVPGLPPATRNELERLQARMQPGGTGGGTILEGPPGSGKTMLARILAATSGRTFVPASCAAWFAAGPLHDHLAAMRATFAEAAAAAPSLVFLDEIDSLGSRFDVAADDLYFRQVINAFLEQVDGILSMGDVVILGATNRIGALDPAILRSGRMGRRIHVPLPDQRGREEILRHLLGHASAAVDIRSFAERCGDGTVPATLAALVAEAVAAARDAGTAVTQRTVEQAFSALSGQQAGQQPPGHGTPAIAVALCARAAMARLVWGSDVTIGQLSVLPGLGDAGRVGLAHVSGTFPEATAADYLAMLNVELAASEGMMLAARKVAERGSGNALELLLPPGPDHAATVARLADRFLASGGLGVPMDGTAHLKPTWADADDVPHLGVVARARKSSIPHLLRTVRKRVSGTLACNLDGLLLAADRLAVEGVMDASRFEAILFSGKVPDPN